MCYSVQFTARCVKGATPSRAPAGAQMFSRELTGGCGRRGSLHHRLSSLDPPGRSEVTVGRLSFAERPGCREFARNEEAVVLEAMS